MLRRTALTALAALILLVAGAAAQVNVVVYDPAGKLAAPEHTAADETLAAEQLVPKARSRWHHDETCQGGSLNIIGVVSGSFTRPGARQRAFVYELCQTGNGFANNGIAVIQDGAVHAHFTYEGGWNLEASRLADINQNGRDELVIETSGGMHQGYTGSSVNIVELSETAVTELASFLAYTNECEAAAPGKFCERSYKLTVRPGKPPVFFSQKFLNRGTDEKPRWVASGRAAAPVTIGDLNFKFELVK